MWQIQKQRRDAEGVHRWQSSGPQRYATREDAEKAVRPTLDRVMREMTDDGTWSTRLRIVPVVETCAVVQ